MLPSLALVFSFVIAQDPAAAPAAPVAPAAPAPAATEVPPLSEETKAAIAKAFQNLTDAPNYTFELKTEGTGGGFGGGRRNREGGGGGGGGAPATPPTTAVNYERGLPLHVKRGEVEAYVAGEVIVYHDAEKDAWEKFDPQAMRESFGRGPGGQGRGPGGDRTAGGGDNAQGGAGAAGGAAPPAGGDGATPPAAGGEPAKPAPEATGGAAPAAPAAPQAAEGENRGGRGAQFNRMRDLMGMQRVRPLHEIVTDPLKFVATGDVTTADGKTTIRGALSKQGADSLSSMGFGGGRGGFGGGGGGDGEGPQREASGTYEIVIDAAGQISSLILDTTLKIRFEEREMERKSKSTYNVTAIGATKIEIPEAALVHFEF